MTAICHHRDLDLAGRCTACGYPDGTHVDKGIRCDRHVGEVFPPRCYDCANLDQERT